MAQDTIFALATPEGRSGVAIIRISGPLAYSTAQKLSGTTFLPRMATLAWLYDPATETRIDQGIVLCFPGPNSFTGEDVVELQCHGSRAVIRSLLKVLAAEEGLREAEPGEFTRRALMNGRMDLSQVEGLGDLLTAETEAQRRLAVSLVEGQLSKKAFVWQKQLIELLAKIEVTIDFSDEDIPEALLDDMCTEMETLSNNMRDSIIGSSVAEQVRGGFEVAVVGAPNVGKSTLLNSIAGRDVALTSEYAGTTRDIIEVHLDLNGLPVTIIDTAGIRDASDPIEHQGVSLARKRATSADLRIFLIETPGEEHKLGIECQPSDFVLLNKSDLRNSNLCLAVSGLTNSGVGGLLKRVSEFFFEKTTTMGLVSHERQRSAIAHSIVCIKNGLLEMKNSQGQPEIVFEHLSDAVGSLEFLVGKTDIETILDSVFGSFCLGK